MSNADSFFGGAAGLSWPKADGNHVYSDTRLRGVVRGGVVVDEPKVVQMTEMGSGRPMFWDEARTRPKEQLVVTLKCDGARGGALDERNPQNPHDDGKRRLYIRGYMVNAVRDALQAAGAEGIRIGGELYVAWVDEKPSKTANFDPARVWAAKYVPPAVGIPQGGAATVPQQGLSGAPSANPFGGTPTPPAAPQQAAPAGPPASPFGGAPAQPADPWGQPPPAPTPAQPGPVNPWG